MERLHSRSLRRHHPEAAAKTLVRLAFSFVVSIVIGTALGFGLALNEFARRSIRPLVVALQITPYIAWLPLAVVWFGAVGARGGVRHDRWRVPVRDARHDPRASVRCPRSSSAPGRTLGADGWQLYREVIFPAALPGYVAGLDQAWGFAWKALMAGELIMAGLRPPASDSSCSAPRTTCPMLVATVAVIVVIGVAVEYLIFGTVDRRIRRRRGLLVDA